MPDLSALPLADLMAAAAAVRDRQWGTRVTYSPKVFIPLTMLCQDRCGYCTFAQPPARLDTPYLEIEQVLAIARAGADVGCHEALFTLGERPELRYPQAAEWLSAHGYSSTIDYLVAAARAVLEETGLLPHANAGALFPDELAALRTVSPSQGMMIESLRSDLACHRGSPDKTPERRLATLDAAGELAIPFTTGILVGIGEDRADRLHALRAIAASHARFGHVQEVIVQNFLPKPGTGMHAAPPCPQDEYLEAIAWARLVLPPEVHVQAPPNLSDDFGAPPRCRHRRLGWGLAGHGGPRQPRAPLARPGPAASSHRSPRLRSGAATHRPPAVTCSIRRHGSIPAWRSRSRTAPTPRDSAARPTAAGTPEPTWHRRCSCRDAPSAGGAVGEVMQGALAGQELTRRRSSPCSRPEGPKWSPWPRLPTRCAASASVTSSPGCPTATSTTRTCAPSSASSAGSPRARSR